MLRDYQRFACHIPHDNHKQCYVTPGALRQSPEGAALALALGYGVLAYLSQVPWLAKDVIWVVSDARCSLISAVEVSMWVGISGFRALDVDFGLGHSNVLCILSDLGIGEVYLYKNFDRSLEATLS